MDKVEDIKNFKRFTGRDDPVFLSFPFPLQIVTFEIKKSCNN